MKYTDSNGYSALIEWWANLVSVDTNGKAMISICRPGSGKPTLMTDIFFSNKLCEGCWTPSR
jgi:hypothetical protein